MREFVRSRRDTRCRRSSTTPAAGDGWEYQNTPSRHHGAQEEEDRSSSAIQWAGRRLMSEASGSCDRWGATADRSTIMSKKYCLRMAFVLRFSDGEDMAKIALHATHRRGPPAPRTAANDPEVGRGRRDLRRCIPARILQARLTCLQRAILKGSGIQLCAWVKIQRLIPGSDRVSRGRSARLSWMVTLLAWRAAASALAHMINKWPG